MSAESAQTGLIQHNGESNVAEADQPTINPDIRLDRGLLARLARPAVMMSLLPAAFGGLATAANASPAKIVPRKGIDGVNIGQTKGQVDHKLGGPSRTSSNTLGSAWDYNSPLDLDVDFSHGRVDGVSTTNTSFTTSKNLGPGATWRSIEVDYPNFECTETGGATDPFDCISKSGHGSDTVQTVFEFLTPGDATAGVGACYVDINRSSSATPVSGQFEQTLPGSACDPLP